MNVIETEKPITPAELSEVEDALRLKLPTDLATHFLTANGGRPKPRTFWKAEEGYDIHQFLSVKHGAVTFEDSYRTFQESEFLPSAALPFAVDEGGDYFYYSVAPSTFGSIFIFRSDYFDDIEVANIKLAGSLDDFLQGLRD